METQKQENKLTNLAGKGHPIYPLFNHEQVQWLYEYGIDISKESIDEILALPRKSLIEDLHKVIQDGINKFSSIKNRDRADNELWFPVHALFLLSELKSVESLEMILAFLKGKYDFLDFWLGDILTEDVWNIVANCSEGKLQSLSEFMKEENINEFAKMTVGDAVAKLGLNKIISIDEAVEWHYDLMQYYFDNSENEALVDIDLNSSLMSNCIDLKAMKTKPLIKKMFEEQMINLRWAGDWNSVEREFEKQDRYIHFLNLESMYEIYQKWYKLHEDSPSETEEFDWDNNDLVNLPFVRAFPKVGRNDSCPCGSGKKFKKCHGVE